MDSNFLIKYLHDKFNGRKELVIDDVLNSLPDLDESDTDELYRILYVNGYKLVDEPSQIFVEKTDSYVYFNDDKLSKLSNESLVKLYLNGEKEALQTLIIKNRWLVYKIAKRQHSIYRPKLEINDLCQSGYLGLIKAAEKFKPELNLLFSTYAFTWIFQSINRSIFDDGFLIRLPVYVHEKINKLNVVQRKYNILSIDDSTLAIFEKELEFDKQEILELIKIKYKYLNCVSIDKTTNEDGDSTISDFIIDTNIDTPEQSLFKRLLTEDISKVLIVLNEREKMVVINRFGLYGNNQKTLEQIGDILGLTRERVRQIESKALIKIKKNKLSKILLKNYLED